MSYMKKPGGNLVTHIFTEKCPKCRTGQVFEKKSDALKLPVMKSHCEICNYQFDREPGYFIGAMYLSYGFAVFQGISTFLICYFFFPNLSTLSITLFVVGVITLFSLQNYKWSRVMYMYIFPW